MLKKPLGKLASVIEIGEDHINQLNSIRLHTTLEPYAEALITPLKADQEANLIIAAKTDKN